MNEWMNEWTNEWMNEWTNEWMNEWMNERMNEWRNEWMLVRSSVCMYVLNKSRHHLEGEMTISKEAAYHWHRNEHGDRCFNARASPHAQVSSLPSFQDAYKLGVKCVMRPQNIASEREETKKETHTWPRCNGALDRRVLGLWQHVSCAKAQPHEIESGLPMCLLLLSLFGATVGDRCVRKLDGQIFAVCPPRHKFVAL